jgi:histidinol-phosphatase
MKPFLETAIEAVSAASVPTLEYFHGSFEVETKSDLTPVTVADRKAEQVIRKIIRTAFPDHGIFGEEYGRNDRDSDYMWLIDPIDGTKSFVRGYGMFSTQLALMHQGEIIVGVSNAPVAGEMAWATRAGGAWLDGKPMRVSAVEGIGDASISTGNLGTLARSARWQNLGDIIAQCNRGRGYGDYYHYHRLASGQLDAVIESDVNILDIAALSLIVQEAGGIFTDLDGRSIDLQTTSVLAATPALHAELRARLG